MANLRRMASLDHSTNIHHVMSSIPSIEGARRLIRHSSLPNLKFGTHSELPWELRFKSFSSTAPANHKASPNYDDGAASDACHSSEASGSRTAAYGHDDFKSVVYTELMDSMWKLAAPSRSMAPVFPSNDVVHVHEHVHDNASKQGTGLLDLGNCSVQGRPLTLKVLKRKASHATISSRSVNKSPDMLEINDQPMSQQHWYGNVGHPKGARHIFTDMRESSVSRAFSSVVYIMSILQQYAFRLQATNMHESQGGHYSNLIDRAYAEMLDSILWLFQHVFACTPKLMLLTMILLADFTLHSIQGKAEICGPKVPVANSRSMSSLKCGSMESNFYSQISSIASSFTCKGEIRHAVLCQDGDGIGGLIFKRDAVDAMNVKNSSHDQQEKLMHQSRLVKFGGDTSWSINGRYCTMKKQHKPQVGGVFQQEDMPLNNYVKPMLLAPVKAPQLEADDYPCYDQTDVRYLHELSMDPDNPLLLANYAQFLHVVRHDHVRAEEFYRKAMKAQGDQVDGSLIGKLATFLWVAKGDVEEAELLYEAAATADPGNAFHAGCYAHFMWSTSANHEAEDTSPFLPA